RNCHSSRTSSFSCCTQGVGLAGSPQSRDRSPRKRDSSFQRGTARSSFFRAWYKWDSRGLVLPGRSEWDISSSGVGGTFGGCVSHIRQRASGRRLFFEIVAGWKNNSCLKSNRLRAGELRARDDNNKGNSE